MTSMLDLTGIVFPALQLWVLVCAALAGVAVLWRLASVARRRRPRRAAFVRVLRAGVRREA